jgi:type IV secretory pathway VirB6-like protein
VKFHLFQTLYDGLLTPVITQMMAMMAPMSAAMQPVALIGISIWLCFAIWDYASGAKTLTAIGRQAFQVVMFYTLIWAGSYTQYVVTLFLHALPDTISAALGGNAQPMALLDDLCGQAFIDAAQVYQAIPAYSFKGAILSVGVILFVVCALCCVGFVFFVTATSAVIMVLVLAVGPVFMAAATIPWTRRYTSGWLSVLVGGAVTQLLGLALIRLMVGAAAALMQQFATTAQDTNSNSIFMLVGLAQIGALLWLFKKAMERVPELAQVIGGGVYHGSNAAFTSLSASSTAGAILLGAATGAAGGARAAAAAGGGASGATIGAMAGGASGAGRAAARGFRYSAPAGRSLSRRAR